jgi:hypothetical protein
LLLATGFAAAQQYPILPVPGSPRNIEHILEDRQGRLWMSTRDDVLCFDGARFFSLPGVPSRTAKAGDTLVICGAGFGPVDSGVTA